MKSPGQLLSEIMRRENVGKTELARRIQQAGLGDCIYQQVHRWTDDEGFTIPHQIRVCVALGLAVDTFTAPRHVARRLGQVRAVFDKFLETRPIAKSMSPADMAVLRSIRFDDPKSRTPTVAFYETVAAVLLGLVPPGELLEVAADNDALDRTLAQKPPLKRR